jgi:branched-subunit amino acid aminotransferase/4-amino-4-deoxychorismate lyase
MTSPKFVVYNGELVASQSVMNADASYFFNGEIISEVLLANGARVYLLKEHYENILFALEFFELNIPANFTLDKLTRLVSRLLNANKFLQGAIIKILIFKNQGHDNRNISYYIFSEQFENSNYIFNRTGLKIGFFQDIRKPTNALSQFRFTNNHLYLKARQFIFENRFDDCLIINENYCIVETPDSNIFFAKGKSIFYPSLKEGSRRNVLQEKVILLSVKSGYKVIEGCNFKYDDIFEIDEIFLVNEISGIRWVVAFESKRFYNKISSNIFSGINKILTDSIT